ncbi:unnamed protein product [Caenorhabditis bovis]|uniref:Conserved oligomeric Golgi complex subunit 1 n=1 Tax=Caenorhabditis bovis TaxID=2654633 RepID=A0A8S1F6D5_9PELO|nr:unnamed protein product [Caenorhabditis bovis]
MTALDDNDGSCRLSFWLAMETRATTAPYCCCEYCRLIANECISTTTLAEYLEAFEGGMYALRLVTEFQTVEMTDVGNVEVPLALSSAIYGVLFEICTKLSDATIAHLLTKKIRKQVSAEISERFAKIFSDRIEEINESWQLTTRTTLQILFDFQLISAMFPGDRMRKLCEIVESHLDPFDVSLLSPLISSNVKLCYMRTQILFAPLLVDSLPTKDVQPPPSYSKVQDLVVHIQQPSRIPMIPRLDRAMSGDLKKSGRNKMNKLLANPHQQGSSKSTPTLSAFYDKISSSWFGGNN